MVQQINALTGDFEWAPLHVECEGVENFDDMEIGKGSLGHTQYLDMLNDEDRNRAYYEAIRQAVKKGCTHVLDIGAGTGLLSMMACQAMKEAGMDTRKVTACEGYLPMFRLARRVLKVNKMDSNVRLLYKRSDDMKVGVDMSSRADLLVSEILDSQLLGEGLIPSLRHAYAHLLSPGARSVPHRATVYGQLVESDYLWRSSDLHRVEEQIEDGLRLAVSTKVRRRFSGCSAAIHVDPLEKYLIKLTEPFKVFDLTFSQVPDAETEIQLQVPIIRNGKLHALISWWDLDLDENGKIRYSTKPAWACVDGGTPVWRNHWKQCVWYFSGDQVTVAAGEFRTLCAAYGDISVKYDIVANNEIGAPGCALESLSSDCVMRPERIGLLGSKKYRQTFQKVITKAVGQKISPLCVVVDDSLLCALLASKRDAQVLAVLPGVRVHGSSHLQAIARANRLTLDKVEFCGKSAAYLSPDVLKGRKIDVLLAEPYYKACEDLQPWSLLRFWYEKTRLTQFLADNCSAFPYRAVLRGVALFLPDLWRSRRRLSEVQGFDHSSANEVLGACGEGPSAMEESLLSYSVWQCGQSKELTDKFTIMEFDFLLPYKLWQDQSKYVPVVNSGLCHAVALWMDWIMDSESECVVSTGPTGSEPNYWKHGIKLLEVPKEISSKSDFSVGAYFQPNGGKLLVDVRIES